MFGIHFNPLNAASPFFNGYDPYDNDDDCCGPDDLDGLRKRRHGLRIALIHVFSFFVLMIAFLGIPSLKIDITFLEPMSIKAYGDDDPARKFADAVSLRIANQLGVNLINLSSNSIYKKEEQKKKD